MGMNIGNVISIMGKGPITMPINITSMIIKKTMASLEISIDITASIMP